MEDTNEHYEKLLGLEYPWRVESVKLDIEKQKVEIEVEYEELESVKCPECNKSSQVYDHNPRRTWRHLDTMQFETLLSARLPRSKCKKCGVKTIKAPWSEPSSRYTMLFERFAIDIIRSSKSMTDAKRILRISWDILQSIMKRGVERGLLRREKEKLKCIGIDEKCFKKGREYISVINDLEKCCVLEVEEGKSKESTEKLLEKVGKERLSGVKSAAMDMSGVYKEVIKEKIEGVKIVNDKFHIVKHINEALVSIWKSERQKDESLNKTKYIWLKNQENYTEKERDRFESIKIETKKVGRGWQLKESLKEFWELGSKEEGEKYFKKWYFWATHSRLKPMIRVAKMLKNHIEDIVTYFEYRITNATSEGLNSKIQQIIFNARGYRNVQNLRYAILFHCGKLSLYP